MLLGGNELEDVMTTIIKHNRFNALMIETVINCF